MRSRYSKVGGEIEVQVMADPDGIVCSVCDHGAGISEFEQARFLQRAATIGGADDVQEPTGFGLRICKDFVDRMGGKFWIDSQPGRGACISFRLPDHAPDVNIAL